MRKEAIIRIEGRFEIIGIFIDNVKVNELRRRIF
jgi:hypothetical protein